LGLVNWQMTQKTAFDLRNKTGSDVFIQASTSPPKPAIPSLSGAKFGREPLRSARFRRLKPSQIVAAYWPKTTETGAV
jgi:hypothetical protein